VYVFKSLANKFLLKKNYLATTQPASLTPAHVALRRHVCLQSRLYRFNIINLRYLLKGCLYLTQCYSRPHVTNLAFSIYFVDILFSFIWRWHIWTWHISCYLQLQRYLDGFCCPKAKFCSRSISYVAGSNTCEGINARMCCWLFIFMAVVYTKGWSLVQRSPTAMYVVLWSRNLKKCGVCPNSVVTPQQKNVSFIKIQVCQIMLKFLSTYVIYI
jgi:hypothetical protein